jgi:hypothetical protein
VIFGDDETVNVVDSCHLLRWHKVADFDGEIDGWMMVLLCLFFSECEKLFRLWFQLGFL